jgi:hypothetical protein
MDLSSVTILVSMSDVVETTTKFCRGIQRIGVCIPARYVGGLQRLKCSKFINAQTVIEIDNQVFHHR